MALTHDALSAPAMRDFIRPTTRGGRVDFLVRGARCAGCISKIERTVAALPGVLNARLNLSTGRLAVEVSNAQADPRGVIEALDRLGYPATPFDPAAARARTDVEGRRLIRHAGFARPRVGGDRRIVHHARFNPWRGRIA